MEDNYHLHVYKVVEKYEIDLEAESSVEAKKFFLLERNPASIDYGFYKDSDLIGK